MKSIHKNENQEVEIIKFLDRHSNKWVTTEEISETLNISRVTVNKLIKSIQIRILKNPHINIDVVQNKGIKFECVNSIYIVDIIQKIYSNSLVYKLITALMNENIVSLEQFAIQNFISLASIRRKISTINDILYDADIRIRNNKIIGNERNVRSFLFKYFWEIHKGTTWPFTNIDKEKLVLLTEEISEKLNIWCSQVSYEQIYYLLAISRLRFKKAHNIESESEIEVLIKNNSLYEESKKIWIEEFPYLYLPENELKYYFFIASSFSLNYVKTNKKELISLKNEYKKRNLFSYLITKRVFEQVEQIYSRDNLEEKQPLLFLELLMYHNKAFLITSDILITSLDRQYFIGKMIQTYPEIFQRLVCTVNKIVEEYPKMKHSKNFLLETYSMFYFQALKKLFLKTFKIFISLSAGRSVEKMIFQNVEQYFMDQFIVEEVKEESEADLCITDSEFTHYKKDKILYIIEPQLTDKDFDFLESMANSKLG